MVRQRFTIAHELGHYFLHANKQAFVDFRDNKKGTPRSLREIHANMFAAALLMPRKELAKDFGDVTKDGFFDELELAMLADKYEVSKEAMQIRLINMGLQLRKNR